MHIKESKIKLQMKKVVKIFGDYLKQKQLKYTAERKTILKKILTIHDHFEADELYLRLRQKGDLINIKGNRLQNSTLVGRKRADQESCFF